MTYPGFFPDMPPQIAPKEEIRLSGHQYGAGGELCLEYRPDNWEPEMTGAMMIESAHRLLAGEEPSEGEQAEVTSAHRSTTGQDARTAIFRFVLPDEVRALLTNMEPVKLIEFVVEDHYYTKRWLAHPKRLGDEAQPLWTRPKGIDGSRELKGYAIRFPDEIKVPIAASYTFLELIFGVADLEHPLELLKESSSEVPVLVAHRGTFKLISLSSGSGSRTVYDYRTVELPHDGPRLSEEYGALKDKTIAIVGCGSIGSKIAVSLARAGVGKFVLVDGDILVPGNLVRNELDARAVGLNKPDALGERIKEVNPTAQIVARRITLGGQESSAATDAALQRITGTDLVVDATADPQIFNLCGSACRSEKTPLIWGEVFAGGIGGLIARSRPEIDPPPHLARRQIAIWCQQQEVPWNHGNAAQYGLAIDADKPPLVADDADVSVIASHMSRMALDILLRTESEFPQSAYAIGMSNEWIFSAPFDVWPIDLRPEGTWGPEVDEHQEEEFAALAEELRAERGAVADEG